MSETVGRRSNHRCSWTLRLTIHLTDDHRRVACSLIMFRKADLLDPIFIILALVCLLLTLMTWSASGRLIAFEKQRSSYNPSLPWHPPPQELLVKLNETLGQDVSALRSIFLPNRVPASGIIEVLEYGEMYVAVLREDLACDVCRDLLVAVVFNHLTREIQNIVPLEPWELQGKPFDPHPILSQFGRLEADNSNILLQVDGITGATKSVEALVRGLDLLYNWTNSHANE